MKIFFDVCHLFFDIFASASAFAFAFAWYQQSFLSLVLPTSNAPALHFLT